MSKITTVYNALLTELATLFSSKTKIPNPYSIPDNMEQFLVNGYGLKIGPSNPSADLVEFCSLNYDQTFTVVLSREWLKLDTETSEIEALTLAFLEDIYSARNLLYSYNELGIQAQISKVEMAEASGIQQVNLEKFKCLYIEVSFTFTISETL